jgi:tryptophan synthase alpha subunit
MLEEDRKKLTNGPHLLLGDPTFDVSRQKENGLVPSLFNQIEIGVLSLPFSNPLA